MIPALERLGRCETFRATVILIGVLHLCFLPCIWGNKSLLASAQDAPSILPSGAWAGKAIGLRFSKTLDSGGGGFLTEPSLPLLRYEYFHDRAIPLWDPYQGFGRPLAADMQSQPFYPLTLALLLHISPRTYNWFILSRLFVAGLCTYLYLRFFVSFWSAMAGAISSMLAGYYLLFLTMPQLSVEVLAPASLLSAEHLLRKRGYGPVIAFAILLLLVFVGGMPESALLLLTLLYAYLVFRIAAEGELRRKWMTVAGRVIAGTWMGFAFSLFLLLPFWEYMQRSFDAHQPRNMPGPLTGLAHDPPGISVFTYFFPLLFGPPGGHILGPIDAGVRDYIGLLSAFLAAVALGTALRRKENDWYLKRLTWFFSCVTLLVLLKRYGLPVINSFGALPLFGLVNFPKYSQVLLSISVCILAAIGVERLARRQVSVRVQATAFALTALLIPTALLFSRKTIRGEIVQMHVKRVLPFLAITVPTFLLLLLAGLLVFANRRKSPATASSALAKGLVMLLAGEMSLNFIAPVYYWCNKLPRQSHDPFLGAPYVDVMKKESAGEYRIIARDGLLFPNWASSFQLFDIRNVDAMYDKKYFPFLVNFFPDHKHLGPPDDLGDRFTGAGNYELTGDLAQRLLKLSSVKYVATLRPFTTPHPMINEVLEQNRGHLIPGREQNIDRADIILAGDGEECLAEHPPYERLPYRIQVGTYPQEIFYFSYGLNPFVFDKTAGDGVEFIIEVRNASGRIRRFFSRYIDPKHNVKERHWIQGQVDLSAYRGQSIELLFTTTPGPKGNSSYDWALWSKFRLLGHDDAESIQAPPFKLIYNGEANVYEYDDVLPRAAVYHHVDLVSGGAEALRKLATPALDIFRSVVVDESALTSSQRSALAEVNSEPAQRVQPARIKSYKSQKVEIETSLDQSGILVLNDTNYPGWSADVDGRSAPLISANYMFRGVLLSPGKHVVRFVYRPKSFYVGLAIAAITAFGFLVFAFVSTRFGTRNVLDEFGSTQ